MEGRRKGRRESFLHLTFNFRKRSIIFLKFISNLILKVLHFWLIFKVLAQLLKSSHIENQSIV